MKRNKVNFGKQSGYCFLDELRAENVEPSLDASDICSSGFREWYMNRRGVLVSTDEAWVESTFADGWIAAYRMLVQDGVPVIAEMRVFPDEPARDPTGRWSAEYLGMRATVPKGGITARLVRRIRPGEHYQAACSRVHGVGKGKRAGRRWESYQSNLRNNLSGRGRKRKPDTFFLKYAADYANAFKEDPTNPVEAVSLKRGLSREKVRAMIWQCRQRKLLDPVIQGRPGGDLTPYARRLLKYRKTKGRTK